MLLIEDMDVAILELRGHGHGARPREDRGRRRRRQRHDDALGRRRRRGDRRLRRALQRRRRAAPDKRPTTASKRPASWPSTDTGTFENIAGATYRRWRATKFTAATMTEKVAATLDARIRTSSGKKPTPVLHDPGIILGVQEQLAARRMNTGETIELKGGYEGLKLNNRDVLEGPWCPKGFFFALNTDKKVVGMVDAVKMGYVDLDGAKLHRIEGPARLPRGSVLRAPGDLVLAQQHGQVNGLTDDNTIRR
jgi:hypothetical protein